LTLYTVGHSNRSVDQLVAILRAAAIRHFNRFARLAVGRREAPPADSQRRDESRRNKNRRTLRSRTRCTAFAHLRRQPDPDVPDGDVVTTVAPVDGTRPASRSDSNDTYPGLV
jgi:hypothetical protein